MDVCYNVTIQYFYTLELKKARYCILSEKIHVATLISVKKRTFRLFDTFCLFGDRKTDWLSVEGIYLFVCQSYYF